MLSGALIKTSLVDYPGKVASAWFLTLCDLRCPYCYSGELVFNRLPPEDSYNEERVFEHLKRRRNVLSGFVISGGEALMRPELPSVIRKAKALGYQVKLDTNGMHPDALEKLFSNDTTSPDFIAVDIKTSPDRYGLLGCSLGGKKAEEALRRSIELCTRLPSDCFEFRTVLVPPLVKKEDIAHMAAMLPKDASWRFAPFRNENCIDPAYNNITPYSDIEMHDLVSYAQSFIPDAKLR